MLQYYTRDQTRPREITIRHTPQVLVTMGTKVKLPVTVQHERSNKERLPERKDRLFMIPEN